LLLKELEEEVTYLYHPDHLGSVSVVSDQKGLPYERVEYLPFGEVWIEETDPATGYIPFRFTSKELDEETGLYYHGARYYEPTISRWMSADPAGFALVNPMGSDGKPKASYSIIEAVNWYAYVSNNPVIYVDPTGEEITLQIHRVFISKRYHASIRIIPENQEKYKNKPEFEDQVDEEGNHYATIGAGPSFLGKLVSNLNRKNDIRKEKVEVIEIDLGGRDEDDVIDALLAADENYGDDVEYDLFSKKGDDVGPFRDGYNSNSYISGLLKFLGFDPPEVKGWSVPGYDKPLSDEYFIRDSWMPPPTEEGK